MTLISPIDADKKSASYQRHLRAILMSCVARKSRLKGRTR